MSVLNFLTTYFYRMGAMDCVIILLFCTPGGTQTHETSISVVWRSIQLSYRGKKQLITNVPLFTYSKSTFEIVSMRVLYQNTGTGTSTRVLV